MWDEHLNRQHRLSYFVRGPEWAFAIPQGDFDVLEEVMARCATFWNGVGSLLIPVSADGRIFTPEVLDLLLRTRSLDACFMHQSLTDAARASVEKRIPGAARLWDSFDNREAHPLHLLGPLDESISEKPTLEVPVFSSVALKRAALALWGHIPDGDRSHWERRYELVERDGEDAYGALLRGQLDGPGASPLRMTARSERRVSTGAIDWPHLWVMGRLNFRELVNMWNLRARTLTVHTDGPPVVGVPRQALPHPQQLRPLSAWLPRIPGVRRTPDVYVACEEKFIPEARAALEKVPLAEETAEHHNEKVGGGATPNVPPSFFFAQPLVGAPFIRGVAGAALVAFSDGRATVSLPAPHGFTARNFSYTRLIFDNLPLPLPVSRSAARRVHRDAEARDGVMLVTDARGQWDFELTLPTAAEALECWVTDHGYALTRSQDGRDAEAVLQRLGSLDELDALADRQRFELLRLLAPDSYKKLAQRLVGEATRAGAELSEQEMVDRLADIGLFLEVEAKTAGDIASGMHQSRPEVFQLLPPLVEAGFVQRAYRVQCPRCRFWQLLDLGSQDERVRCRACGDRYLLPVVDESGQREPERYYRLDGLMARAMDQDVLPMLLTLRALRPPPEHGQPFCAWPGVEFDAGDGKPPVEVDLVVSTGRTVWLYETKQNARTLKAAQLRRRLELAADIGARPGIAGLDGSFPPELAREVDEARGRVLTGADLLA